MFLGSLFFHRDYSCPVTSYDPYFCSYLLSFVFLLTVFPVVIPSFSSFAEVEFANKNTAYIYISYVLNYYLSNRTFIFSDSLSVFWSPYLVMFQRVVGEFLPPTLPFLFCFGSPS